MNDYVHMYGASQLRKLFKRPISDAKTVIKVDGKERCFHSLNGDEHLGLELRSSDLEFLLFRGFQPRNP